MASETRFFTGGMNFDEEPLYVPNGNYIEARNMRGITTAGGTTGDMEQILGGEELLRIGSVAEQSKEYVIIFNVTIATLSPTKQLVLQLYKPSDPTFAAPLVLSNSIPVTAAVLVAALNAALIAPYSSYVAFSVTSDPNAIKCVIDDEDIFLTKQSSQTASLDMVDKYNIYTVKELVVASDFPNSVTKLRPIASNEIGKYTYVWSCIKRDVEKNGSGISELGRFCIDPNYGTANYTPILRTRYWNFGSKQSFDKPKPEIQAGRHNHYWSDNFNSPRAVYLDYIDSKVNVNGTVVTAISPENVDFTRIRTSLYPAKIRICDEERTVASVTANTITVTSAFSQNFQGVDVDVVFMGNQLYYSESLYDSTTIDVQTKHVIPYSYHDTTVVQVETGGSLTAASRRYFTQLETSDGNTTNWSTTSQQVPTYSAQSARPDLIIGDMTAVPTNKKNIITASNISGLSRFTKIRFACVEYNEDGRTAFIFNETPLSTGQDVNTAPTSVTVEHVGNETTQPLTVDELIREPVVIETWETCSIVDGVFVAGNITRPGFVDLSDWFAEAEHKLVQQEITACGLLSKPQKGEYQDEINVANYGGHMWNETVRYGAKAYYKNGYIQPFWIDDIKIDSSATNITTPNRRTAGLGNIDITNSDLEPLIVGIEWSFDFDAVVDGHRVGDILEKIEILYATVPEVLCSGVVVISQSTTTDGVALAAGNVRTRHLADTTTPLVGASRRNVTFYSMDNYYGGVDLNFISGDTLLVVGAPPLATAVHGIGVGTDSKLYEFSGEYSSVAGTAYNSYSISNMIALQKGSSGVLGANIFTNAQANNAGTDVWTFESTFAIRTTADVVASTAGTDHGIYPAQYFRAFVYTDPDNCKFGPRSQQEYIPTGSYINNNGATFFSGVKTLVTFPPDTFTQKTFFKQEYYRSGTSAIGAGFSFYGQHRSNYQLRSATAKLPNVAISNEFVFPYSFSVFSGFGLQARLNMWLSYADQVTAAGNTNYYREEFIYNTCYTYRWELYKERNFQPGTKFMVREGANQYFSTPKQEGTQIDPYRNLLPLNQASLTGSDGDIHCLIRINKELYAIQDRGFVRQFVNERGILEVVDGAQVTFGTGKAFSQPAILLSHFGTKHKTSVCLGESGSGDDTCFYVDTINRKIIRFNAQGISVISDTKFMNSFLQKYMGFADNSFSPADLLGIHSYYDQRFREAFFTFRTQRRANIHVPASAYSTGDYVMSATTTFGNDAFYKFDYYIYVAKQNVPGGTAIANTTYWEQIPYSDSRGYGFFTLVWSEDSQAFKFFFDDIPSLWISHNNDTLSGFPVFYNSTVPTPSDFLDRIDLKYKGAVNTWYTFEGDSGDEFYRTTSYVQTVVNNMKDWVKRFLSSVANSTKQPYRAEYENSYQETFQVEANMLEFRENQYEIVIQNDSTGTGLNDGDTDNMKSDYLLAKIIYNYGGTQGALKELTTSFRALYKKKSI